MTSMIYATSKTPAIMTQNTNTTKKSRPFLDFKDFLRNFSAPGGGGGGKIFSIPRRLGTLLMEYFHGVICKLPPGLDIHISETPKYTKGSYGSINTIQ